VIGQLSNQTTTEQINGTWSTTRHFGWRYAVQRRHDRIGHLADFSTPNPTSWLIDVSMT
jgi:hypothetical protein